MTAFQLRRRRQRRLYLFLLGLLFLAALLWHRLVASFGPFPQAWNIHLRDVVDAGKDWVIANRASHPLFTLFFVPLSSAIDFSLRRMEDGLLWLPWPAVLLGAFLWAGRSAGLRLGLLAFFSLLFMGLVGMWDQSMQTLALMVVSVAISLLVGIPLGIVTASHDRFEAWLRPILDGMQTMPAFVYLIPVLLFFGVARVPSVVATVIYAIPPAIRLTNLGLRQVDAEVVEAARAFGSTPRQLLFKVQLPLALPAIMAGVNQTIMMALSIVVIAALIGAGGLGKEVLLALQRLQVGKGLEAGLAIVFLAILLDRLSEAFTRSTQIAGQKKWQRFRLLPSGLGRFALAHTVEDGLARLAASGQAAAEAVAAALALPFAWLLRLAGRQHAGSRLLAFFRRHAFFFASLALLLLLLLASLALGLDDFPRTWRLPLYNPVDRAVAWMRDNLYQIGNLPLGTGPFSDFITIYTLDPLLFFLRDWLAWPVILLGTVAVALAVSGWRLALASAAGLLLVGVMGMWELSIDTLSQTIVAVSLSVLIAVPLGIWSARSDTLEALLRPIMDTLQTIPPFVYLVPVIMLFNVGRVPGIIASVLYALPPAIRLTNLGIRQVDAAVVEAGRAFGSTPRQLLLKVQLPLALPSILLGINQTVMMVLAMVIIAGLVGGAGLGLEAVIGLAKNQTGRGVEAGLAIVIMAIIIDRLTQAWARNQEVA